jgi:hypothetical protein
MLPGIPPNDAGNGGVFHRVLDRQRPVGFSGSTAFSDLQNLIGGEFRLAAFFASRCQFRVFLKSLAARLFEFFSARLATLSNPILNIVHIRSQKKMLGVNAPRIVAGVQNRKISGVDASFHEVHNAAGDILLILDAELTITAQKRSSFSPWPAFIFSTLLIQSSESGELPVVKFRNCSMLVLGHLDSFQSFWLSAATFARCGTSMVANYAR